MRTVLLEYTYPTNLLPDLHHSVYQLIVGVEQGHKKDNLLIYATNLRNLMKDVEQTKKIKTMENENE